MAKVIKRFRSDIPGNHKKVLESLGAFFKDAGGREDLPFEMLSYIVFSSLDDPMNNIFRPLFSLGGSLSFSFSEGKKKIILRIGKNVVEIVCEYCNNP